MKFLDLKYEAFGLDINDTSLKIIKLEKRQEKFSVCSFNRVEIKPGIVEAGVIQDKKALIKIIKTACDKVGGWHLHTKYVVASLPEEESFLQVIQMPKMSPEELKSAVVFEAENYIPLPIDQVYLDFQTIDPLDGDSESLDHIDVLVVATPKLIVDSYVSCFKSAGLNPLILEIESQSIIRSLVKNETSEYPIVVLDLGEDSTDFIVSSGHSIRFTFSMPVSQRQFNSAIAEALKIDIDKAEKMKVKYGISDGKEKATSESKKILSAAEPILEELITQTKKYIDFYQEHASHEHLSAESGVKKVLLCGGGANISGLPEFLTKKLDIPVEVGDPFANLPRVKKDRASSINLLPFTTALGLAVRGIDIKKEDIND